MAMPTPPISVDAAGLESHFQDLDRDDIFNASLEQLKHPSTQNFVVEFSATKARVGFDFESSQSQWEGLLTAARPATNRVRWINIFAPNLQKEAVKVIASHYNLSPRLKALMASDPPVPEPVHTQVRQHSSILNRYRRSEDVRRARLSADSRRDVEKHANISERPVSSDSTVDMLDLSHYQLVNEVWHFASVDRGKNYLCLGYNTLHGGSKLEVDQPIEEHNLTAQEAPNKARSYRDVPRGKRLWSWLLLCDDNTVISMYEDPCACPSSFSEHSSAQQADVLLSCRRNLINVFRHVSLAKSASIEERAIYILDIRSGLGLSNNDESSETGSFVTENGSSLLFYYLFDDWYLSYGLVARKEQQYGARLTELRKKMLKKADIEYINQLHHLGRQLAVLKRIYQSYKILIDHVLEGQKLNLKGITGATNLSVIEQSAMENPESFQDIKSGLSVGRPTLVLPSPSSHEMAHRGRYGPPVTPAAIARFERLRDRIEVYALSEIQDCLDEKDSMALMNFNLIALKESQAVEHLTRITIFFAKFTILFLPVSLMTSYFSTQIQDLHYTQKIYWTAFAVIMSLTYGLLAFFGYISGTVEGNIIYQPLSTRLLNVLKGFYRALVPKKKRPKSS